MANELSDVRAALARAVAGREFSDDVIDSVARRIAGAKHPIRGIDICERGICIDYIIDGSDWRATLPELVEMEGGLLRGVEVFPWGIINPDVLHVRVMQEFEEVGQRTR